jgi:glycolate oxidase FAD binding subunit
VSMFAPATEAEAVSVVMDARAHRTPLVIEGGGTRTGLGRPVQAAATLSTKSLSGIVFYEPAELVIRARAGTPLADVEAALAEKGQVLPFEPMDHRGVYGSQGEPTIGAVASCNISGPRRIRNGAARDSLIGVRFINGEGEIVNNGGRVMKNVTGLDLVKLQCGAFGTLGMLTEVTFKVIPDTQRTGTLVFDDLDDSRAVEAMSAALGSPFEVSGAAHVPGRGTFLRIEHFAPSVNYRLGELEKLLVGIGPAKRLGHDESLELWREIRDVVPLAAHSEEALWRVSVAPSAGPQVVATLRHYGRTPAYFFDWGGGLVWLTLPAGGDAGAAALRAGLAKTGGHATLVRAPDDVRHSTDVFQPLAQPLMKITAGIKASVDSAGIFNPGRMYAGV